MATKLARVGIVVALIVLAGCGDVGSTSSSPAAADNGSASASAKATARVAQVLLDVQGTGTKSTQKFTAGGDWDLNWSYDCSSFGANGNFSVILYGQNSSDMKGIPVNELGAKGADVSHQHDSGTFYLEVNSECAWHVTVKG